MRLDRPSDHIIDPMRRPRGRQSAWLWLVLGTMTAIALLLGMATITRTWQSRPAVNSAQAAGTPVVGPNEQLIELTPEMRAVGWVRSDDNRNNRFGDSFVYSGVAEGAVFDGAMQFDLSELPRGAPLRYAALVLTGLDGTRVDQARDASWQARWLAPAVNDRWLQASFQDIHNAAVLQTLLPPVGPDELQADAINTFPFSEAQLRQLEQALVDQQTQIAFRIDGPQTGPDNLFAWDSGYGDLSSGRPPRLVVVVGTPPATPPPTPTRNYVVVTSTPTPENVFTAAAIVRRATAQATQTGTATPTPTNMVTATPTAENEATAVAWGVPWAVTPTPTPADPPAATAMAAYATAQALTTGTWTPTPDYYVTATATPTFIVITNTPTPSSASALLAWAVAQATRIARDGPPTPIPAGVATATPRWIVVTATPTAENAATVQAVRILATVAALTSGTYTPVPPNLLVATPTPGATPLPLVAVLSPTPTRTPVPNVIPDALRGKIVFRSDRLGGEQLFVMDPACALREGGCPDSEVGLLRDKFPYELAQQQQLVSPDGNSRLFVQMELQADASGLQVVNLPRVMIGEVNNAAAFRRLSPWGGGAYDPVWSPTGDRVALVSTDSGNDEIYVIAPDGTNAKRLTTNTWEWDKHPSWSPDGQSIVFYSNRDSGRRQLWMMNADGSGQRNISGNTYNDWDPIWIK